VKQSVRGIRVRGSDITLAAVAGIHYGGTDGLVVGLHFSKYAHDSLRPAPHHALDAHALLRSHGFVTNAALWDLLMYCLLPRIGCSLPPVATSCNSWHMRGQFYTVACDADAGSVGSARCCLPRARHMG